MPNIIKNVQFNGIVQPYSGSMDPISGGQVPEKPDHEKLLEEAREQAQEIIEAAKAYREEMIHATTQQLNQERDQLLAATREEGLTAGRQEGERLGRDAGYQSGYREGFTDAQEEVFLKNQDLVDQIGTLLEKLQETREQAAESWKEEIGALAFDIAETVINREILLPESALIPMIDAALDRFREQEWLRVYLSETMAERLENEKYSLSNRLTAISKTVKVIPAKEFEDGDCIIEYAKGAIEVSAGAQMGKIREVIKW